MELIFADLEAVEKRRDRVAKMVKTGDKKYKAELEMLERIHAALEDGKPARSVEISKEEQEYMKDLFLLTTKPVIYAANVAEDDFVNGIENNPNVKKLEELAKSENAEVLPISAQIEEELSELDDDDKAAYLNELGLKESGLNRLVKKSYSLLGLISFLTSGSDECRAWTIKKGTKAPQAAGKIHTDFEKGFIRAEVVSYDDLMACGTYAAAREKGLVRLEGKDYVMNDGDIVLFRFNV